MRFFDEIMRDTAIDKKVKDLLDGSIVVAGDNVASYYYEGTDKEHWYLEDFPNIAPPWGRFWFDFKAPSRSISSETGTRTWGADMPSYWGLHCQAQSVDDVSQNREFLKEYLLEFMSGLYKGILELCPDIHEVLLLGEDHVRAVLSPEQLTMLDQLISLTELLIKIEDGSEDWQEAARAWMVDHKWVVDVTAFMKIHVPSSSHTVNYALPHETFNIRSSIGGLFQPVDVTYHTPGSDKIMGPIWTWRIFITKEGKVAQAPHTNTPLMMSHPKNEMATAIANLERRGKSYEEALTEVSKGVSPFLHTGLLSISFLHCRNVSLNDVTPPKHIVRNKSAKRRGEQDYQPVAFKTLDIRPMREILKREEQGAPQGEKTQRALHICRGHFKDYTEGRGLFGKYKDTFWWADQVRGNKMEGVRIKDYRIKL
jgi:hypothetical protein